MVEYLLCCTVATHDDENSREVLVVFDGVYSSEAACFQIDFFFV